nr:dTDP-4-dehydrorhamnose reductase [Jannaschia sp. S6380]
MAFGRTGQVARALASHGVVNLDRAAADLSVPGACDAAIRAARPRAVINAAAWTDVDGAEDAEAAAMRINADAPGEMSRTCAELDLPFVHLSTDYVFDGSGTGPWRPDDPVAPLGAYGRSKLAGERAVTAAGGRHVVLRTSWVFSGTGRNFVTTMLRLGAERDRLSVVNDQVGGPTPAAAIADACGQIVAAMAEGAPSGIHHFAGSPDIDWAGFARAIFATAGVDCAVDGIAAADWPAKAPRPSNSRLDCSALADVFGIGRPDWRAALKNVVGKVSRR